MSTYRGREGIDQPAHHRTGVPSGLIVFSGASNLERGLPHRAQQCQRGRLDRLGRDAAGLDGAGNFDK